MERSDCRSRAVKPCDCPRPQLAKEQPPACWGLWEARQGRSTQRTRALRARVLLHAYVLGGSLLPPRSWEALPPRTRTQVGHTPARAWGLLCPRARPVANQESAKRWWPPGHRRRIQQRPGACSWTPHAYVAGPFRAPVLGLERPRTRRHRIGADYVTRAPGALVTPHSWRSTRHAMCLVSTILGGGPGHAMCPGSTDCPCYPSKRCFPCFSVLFRPFRLFDGFRGP